MQNQNCEIKADSTSTIDGSRLTTILFKRFPYRLVQEPGTHRSLNPCSTFESINPFGLDFSRSSASTRAVPLERLIDSISSDPYIPAWTRNQKGMQGGEIDAESAHHLNMLHLEAMGEAFRCARFASGLGAHKQEVNGYLIPWLRIPILLTGHQDAWENFFDLRCADSAHPDFREQAISARDLYLESAPRRVGVGDWHLPFGDTLEVYRKTGFQDLVAAMAAAANCARLSYASHDGDYSLESQLRLAEKLLHQRHWSPFEHIAVATGSAPLAEESRNLQPYEWIPLRTILEKKRS